MAAELRLHVFDDPDVAASLSVVRDFVPRPGVDPEPREWTPGPALKPGLHERCITCEHGHPSQPTTLAWCFYVVDRPETRDPGWWRARLPHGVDFRLVMYPDGVDGPEALKRGRVLGVFPSESSTDGGPVPVEPAPEVMLQTPEGAALATLSQVRREDGRPVYFVAPIHWRRITDALRAKGRASKEPPPGLGPKKRF